MKKKFILLVLVVAFSCKATHFVKEDIQKDKLYGSNPSTFVKITRLITTLSVSDGHRYYYPGMPGHYFAQVDFLVSNNSKEILLIDFRKLQLKSQEGIIYNSEQIDLNFLNNTNTRIKPSDSKERTIVFQYPYKVKPAFFIYNGVEYKIAYN